MTLKILRILKYSNVTNIIFHQFKNFLFILCWFHGTKSTYLDDQMFISLKWYVPPQYFVKQVFNKWLLQSVVKSRHFYPVWTGSSSLAKYVVIQCQMPAVWCLSDYSVFLIYVNISKYGFFSHQNSRRVNMGLEIDIIH